MIPSKLLESLVFAVRNNWPILVVGRPGIGKSDIITEACRIAKAKLIITHPVVSDPVDFKGMPIPSKDGESAKFVPFGDLQDLIDAKEKTVYFLDDLGHAPASVQAACFPRGTLVLGESYRDIADIVEGESVIGDDGRPHKVTHKFEIEYDGKIYDITSINRIPITATQDHPFEVIETFKRENIEHNKPRVVSPPVWKEAKDLVVGEYVGTPIIDPYIDDEEIYVGAVGSFKRTVSLSNEFARFLGYYVGNGYCVNHPKVLRVGVCFNLAHKEKIADCKNIMKNIFGQHVFEKIDGNCIYLAIHDKYLKEFFHEHLGDDVYDKKIPEFILYHKNIEYLSEFLKGYFMTDGCAMVDKGVKRGVMYSTVSKKLALQTQMAFARLGTMVGIKIKPEEISKFPNGRKYQCRESYAIQVSSSDALSSIGFEKDEIRVVNYSFIHNNKLWTRITSIDSYNYQGIVYNLEVEGVNTYTANNYIVHNCMQLLLARRVNGHKVSDYVTFMAATNRREDRAGVQGILDPVKSRFTAILELDVSLDDWVAWAYKNKMPEQLISFIKYMPDTITKQETNSAILASIANTANPRTIYHVGQLMNAGMPNGCEHELVAGAAGKAFATMFMAFLKLYGKLPDLKQILDNPEGAFMPTEIDQLFAVSGMLSFNASIKNFKKAVHYIQRMGAEYQAMTIRDSIHVCSPIANMPEYKEWITQNRDFIL